MAGKYIAVAGTIGAGKSSLVEFLCRKTGLKPIYEPHETNPYLEDFYKDMKRWAFPSQTYFLSRKFRLHQETMQGDEAIVQDRTIYEDAEVFAKNLYEQGLMDKRDFQTYWELYESLRDALRPPDLLIALKADVKTIRKRIDLRGRAMEKEIPLAYLRRLHTLYEAWFENYRLSPMLVIKTDKIDYLTDMVDQIEILRQIEAHLSGRDRAAS